MTFKPNDVPDIKRINNKRRCAICGDYYEEDKDRQKHMNCVYEYERFDKI